MQSIHGPVSLYSMEITTHVICDTNIIPMMQLTIPWPHYVLGHRYIMLYLL